MLYYKTEKGLYEKNEAIEMAKTGATDVQDDFRNTEYNLVKIYSEDNVEEHLFGSKGTVTETERQILEAGYKDKIIENSIFIQPKKHENSMKNIYKVKSENKERIYYYEFNNVYHSSKFCSHLSSAKNGMKIYSSMEECAISGAFPCIKCVLGYER